MVHHGLLIILDGMGDRPIDLFDGATPLEAAHTPNLDRLASDGQCCLVDPLGPGIPVGTHTGAGALMGLGPDCVRELRRGPIEAAGVGMEVNLGDVALRANFATLHADGRGWQVLDRRAARIRSGVHELASVLRDVDLGDGIRANLEPATEYRAVLRLSGSGLSDAISDTDPGDSAEEQRMLTSRPLVPGDGSAERTAEALNRFMGEAYERLSAHPVNERRRSLGEPLANGVIARGAGTVTELRGIVGNLGLKAAVVAGERTLLGLGVQLGFQPVTAPEFTSHVDTDVAGKVAAARRALQEHDLVFLHFKAPDICSHDRDPLAKKEFFERVDAELGWTVDGELVVGVAADHSTDSASGHHCGDPVPALLYRPAGRRDGCASFGEGGCMQGGMGRMTSASFLVSLLDAMGVLPNFHPGERRYFG